MKTAFLFPGQGAQFVGMASDIAGAFRQADEIFNRANDIVGFDLKSICFEGPAEKLDSTVISQPAIFTVSAAILEVIRTSTSLCPDVTAGLSLGEYTALYAAGIMSFEDGLRLVQTRGAAMQAAADATQGTMVSIIGLDEEKVRELCDQARQGEVLEPVNFNCPGQIVVSGSIGACQRAEQAAEKFGAMKAVKLSVAGAFHTEIVSSAADDLKAALENTGIKDPSGVRTIANINADYYKDSSEISTGLIKQLTSALQWHKSMEKLIAEGIEGFYEIGPGRVLTGLMKRINRKIKVVNVSDVNCLEKIVG